MPDINQQMDAMLTAIAELKNSREEGTSTADHILSVLSPDDLERVEWFVATFEASE